MLYPIIIAGGQGTRLWPVSRKKNPKQIRPFLGEKTLLCKTYERLLKIVPKEHIFLSTTKQLVEEAKYETPGILDRHILAEPARRDTAAALGLALVKLYQEDKRCQQRNIIWFCRKPCSKLHSQQDRRDKHIKR